MRDPNATVAGVRFRNAGKIFYFHAAGMRLDVGEHVVVETTRGPEIARVVISPDQVVVNELGREELKPILRLATDEDIEKMDRLKQRAEQILPEARQIASDTRFPAQLDGAEFTLDGKRITFSFTSEDRLDYRDFIRRAGERFGTKVDMRQMGARDRAKLAGGYGICGRELCCSSWLSAFPSISIRMAKEQDLPLNPQKISGLCGRLLCCLSYEEEGYKEMRKTLPKIGQRCSTPTGEGKVIGINILRRQVTLLVQGQRIEVPDRDLGLVVRWDSASKAGDPPPSISRADAIEQGLIEATEDDILAAARAAQDGEWLPQEVDAAPGPGRGRLPGGGPRKEIRNRPPKGPAPVPGVGSATGRRRGGRGATPPGEERGSQQGGDTQQPRRARNEGARRERAAGPPEGRVFQRSAPPTREVDSRPAEPLGTNGPTPLDGADGSTAGTPRARRGRGRRGRGSSGGGNAPQP